MRSIIVHGLLLTSLFVAIAWLAPRLDVGDVRKPMDAAAAFTFVGLMLAAGSVWWSCCRTVRDSAVTRSQVCLVLGFTLLFRAIVFTAPPILELDLYRYLWDGFVSAHEVNPFRYSPAEVSEAIRFGEFETDPTLRSLADAVERVAAMATILERVHYPDLSTVYPPVAQAVFRVSEAMGAGATLERRVLVLKSVLVACELGGLVLAMILLRRVGRSSAWIILPAWCPLAVVSVANQCHLDSLPALLAVAAVVAISAATIFAALSGGVLLALAGAAKIYPLLLAPLVAVYLWSRSGPDQRTRKLIVFASALAIASLASWSPLFRQESRREGFAAFAGQWQMYDSFFAVVAANVKPNESQTTKPWYSIIPEPIKRGVPYPDRIARTTWVLLVGIIGVYLTRRLWLDATLERLLECAFLLLVWFWALGPVCNPWYLMWMLPFLPFTRNAGWLALFVTAPALFLRFGMSARFGESGEYWFDHGVVFGLTACWLVAVLVCRRRDQRLESNSTGTMTFKEPERNPSRSTLT